MTPIAVRRATVDDSQALIRMAVRFLAESSYRGVVTPNPAHLEKMVTYLLEQGLLLIATQHDEAIGMLGMALVPSPISGEATASEVCWWVEPEHRGGQTALRLWSLAETWARSVGAMWIQMIAPAGSDIGRWYERLGYGLLEDVYQKRVA